MPADRPAYDEFVAMDQARGPLGAAFARQVLATTADHLPGPPSELDVLDVGSGYGHTAAELASRCRSVVGLEPARALWRDAERLRSERGLTNLHFRLQGVGDLEEVSRFDLVVLDNVYEHLPDQPDALARIVRALRPGGVLYVLVPNKLWPIEAHYHLPGLSWLPLPLAHRYLRLTGRGTDYTDASYAPTYWSLKRDLARHAELDAHFVLPGVRDATVAGQPPHYRLGMAMLERFPALWAISKALLVVAVKRPEASPLLETE